MLAAGHWFIIVFCNILNSSYIAKYFKYIFRSDFTDGIVNYYNWWLPILSERDLWFSNFIKFNFPENQQKINMYSVFGPRNIVSMYHKQNKKIFFTGENVHKGFDKFISYDDLCLKSVDLSLGFDYLTNERYIRFPLWIIYIIPYTSDEKVIQNVIMSINIARSKNLYQCALIASHDLWNTRTEIYNDLKNIMEIKCPGKWNHNTDDLWDKYGNDKLEYLRYCKFNICPENISTYGYVTEKLFDAMRCGCIPIYSGSDNRPEPGLINPDSVILWDNANPKTAIDKIRILSCEENAYNDFISQEKLTPLAVEYIAERLYLLKKAIANLIT